MLNDERFGFKGHLARRTDLDAGSTKASLAMGHHRDLRQMRFCLTTTTSVEEGL